MVPSNVKKKKLKKEKKKGITKCDKVLSNVMLVLPNVTMKPSNVRKKIREHQM